MVFEAVMTAVPQVLAVTPQALATVPGHIAQSAYENPVTTGVIGGALYGAMTTWEKYRPRLAERLARCQASWELSPAAARWHDLKAVIMRREAPPRRVSWQEDAWLKCLPTQLGPFIMTMGILHALRESWHVAQNLPRDGVYQSAEFQLPYGMATMTAGFLTLVLGIEAYARGLERRIEHQTGDMSVEARQEIQKQIAHARMVQKIAAYICILDDIFPIMVFMQAIL